MTDTRRVDFADIRNRADFRAVLSHYGLEPGRGVHWQVIAYAFTREKEWGKLRG